jgi:hypothetical protein
MQRPKYIKAWPVVIPYWTTGERTLLHQAVEGVRPNKVGVRSLVTNLPIERCKCNLCESMGITTWVSRGSEIRMWVDTDDLRVSGITCSQNHWNHSKKVTVKAEQSLSKPVKDRRPHKANGNPTRRKEAGATPTPTHAAIKPFGATMTCFRCEASVPVTGTDSKCLRCMAMNRFAAPGSGKPGNSIVGTVQINIPRPSRFDIWNNKFQDRQSRG